VATKLQPGAVAEIVTRTLDHYAERIDTFWEGTRDHDVSQNIRALLRYIEGEPPFTILDLGCGPGRDLRTLAELGHAAIGIDGVEGFASMARDYSGCEVWQQDFLKLDLPPGRFDGVFANAALFHVPSQELPRVLGELRAALKPRGVLFSSNPHGTDEEGWNRGRYGAYHRIETWRRYVSGAGFVELEHYYRPEGLPREQQPWLATVWRKTEKAGRDSAVNAP
jgi:SAM-dependent methyltransferase